MWLCVCLFVLSFLTPFLQKNRRLFFFISSTRYAGVMLASGEPLRPEVASGSGAGGGGGSGSGSVAVVGADDAPPPPRREVARPEGVVFDRRGRAVKLVRGTHFFFFFFFFFVLYNLVFGLSSPVSRSLVLLLLRCSRLTLRFTYAYIYI
jgi:hypothetical protein